MLSFDKETCYIGGHTHLKTKILDCMKKLLTLILLLMVSVEMYAQSNVTTFLGIPIDGTKSSMIQQLEKKGFVYHQKYDQLEGEFNGEDVSIEIGTQKGKVYAISVHYCNSLDSEEVKMTYENLCRQFRDNPKYMALSEDSLPESKDLGYEMTVNKRSYASLYIQNPQFNESDKDRLVMVSLLHITAYSVGILYVNGLNKANGEDL